MNRKLSHFAVASVVLAFCVAPAFPQSAPPPKAAAKEEALPSVDELAAKCAKASGGKEAWAKLTTQVLDGTIELPTFGLSGKVKFIAKAPNKMLHVVTSPLNVFFGNLDDDARSTVPLTDFEKEPATLGVKTVFDLSYESGERWPTTAENEISIDRRRP